METAVGSTARTGLTGRARPTVELVDGVEAARGLVVADDDRLRVLADLRSRRIGCDEARQSDGIGGRDRIQRRHLNAFDPGVVLDQVIASDPEDGGVVDLQRDP